MASQYLLCIPWHSAKRPQKNANQCWSGQDTFILTLTFSQPTCRCDQKSGTIGAVPALGQHWVCLIYAKPHKKLLLGDPILPFHFSNPKSSENCKGFHDTFASKARLHPMDPRKWGWHSLPATPTAGHEGEYCRQNVGGGSL